MRNKFTSCNGGEGDEKCETIMDINPMRTCPNFILTFESLVDVSLKK